MITHVRIKNFRSFGVTDGSKNQEFDFGKFSLIVGDNSSGKSNILRALRCATNPSVDDVERHDFFIRVGRDKDRKKERKSGHIEIELKCQARGGGKPTTILCKISGTSRDGFRKVFKIGNKIYPEIVEGSTPHSALVKSLERYATFVAPPVRDVEYLKTTLDMLPQGTTSTIKDSQTKLIQKLNDKLRKIAKQLKGSMKVSGIDVTAEIDFSELMKITKLNFLVNDQVHLPLANLGQGLVSKAILKLVELQGGNRVICIEEPEVHVHPTAIRSVIRAFREFSERPSRQVLMTTHSAEVVNCSTFDSLLSLKKIGNRTEVTSLGQKDIPWLRDREELEFSIVGRFQQGVIFLSKRVLLVEGPYDRLFLEYLESVGKIKIAEQDIVVVECGGYGEIGKFAEVLRLLKKPYAILLDDNSVVQKGNGFPTGKVFADLFRAGTVKERDFNKVTRKAFSEGTAFKKRRIISDVQATIREEAYLVSLGFNDLNDYLINKLLKIQLH